MRRDAQEMQSVTLLPCYRCYFLDSEKHIVDVEVLHQCVNDAEAQQAATCLLEHRRQFRGVLVCDRARTVFEKLIAFVSVVSGANVAGTLHSMLMLEWLGATLLVWAKQ